MIPTAPTPLALTPRQRSVVLALLAGRRYRAIAGELRIAVRTVRAHVHAIAIQLEGTDPPLQRVLRSAARLGIETPDSTPAATSVAA